MKHCYVIGRREHVILSHIAINIMQKQLQMTPILNLGPNFFFVSCLFARCTFHALRLRDTNPKFLPNPKTFCQLRRTKIVDLLTLIQQNDSSILA